MKKSTNRFSMSAGGHQKIKLCGQHEDSDRDQQRFVVRARGEPGANAISTRYVSSRMRDDSDSKLCFDLPMMFSGRDSKLCRAFLAKVTLAPFGFLTELVEQAEEKLLGGHLEVEDGDALAVQSPQNGASLHQTPTQRTVAFGVGYQESCNKFARVTQLEHSAKTLRLTSAAFRIGFVYGILWHKLEKSIEYRR